MNIYAKIHIVLIILGLSLAGILFWQAKPTQNSNSQSPSISESTNENVGSNFASFIENLRKRDYESSQIMTESAISNNGSYTGYLISYRSDGLKIYGRMNIPVGNGPFPVIILNHGYFNQASFTSGDGTQNMADILARNGYLTLASDYRGFGKSENDDQRSRGHNPNYAIDVLNLIASVKTLDKADSRNIGMWGHSMGGEVALRVLEATGNIKATVLWAPTATRESDTRGFRGGASDSSDEGAAPMNYLYYIQTPISLHQGLSDTEVNPEVSKQLNEALLKQNKMIEYFEYEGQDHNFRNLGWDVISKRTIEFFDRFLKTN